MQRLELNVLQDKPGHVRIARWPMLFKADQEVSDFSGDKESEVQSKFDELEAEENSETSESEGSYEPFNMAAFDQSEQHER